MLVVIFLPFLLLLITYIYVFRGIAFATRTRQQLHFSRANVSAMIIVLSFVMPLLILAFLVWTSTHPYSARFTSYEFSTGEDGSIGVPIRLHFREQVVNPTWFEYTTKINKEDMVMSNEHFAAMTKIQAELVSKTNISYAEQKDYDEAINYVSRQVGNPTKAKFRNSGQMLSHVGMNAKLFLNIFPILLFAIPGTVWGIGYVNSVRTRKERPGLAAALFAALTWPSILIVVGTVASIILFGLVGFLIALTVIAIFVGIYFGVRYWLSHS
jgi:hypothetical protein